MNINELVEIHAIQQFCFLPKDWDRHHIPSVEAIDHQIIQSPWEDSNEFVTQDAEMEDEKLSVLQQEVIQEFQQDIDNLK